MIVSGGPQGLNMATGMKKLYLQQITVTNEEGLGGPKWFSLRRFQVIFLP